MNLKKLLKKLIPYTFYALLIIFLVVYLRSIDFATLQTLHMNWWPLLLALLLGLAFRFWGAYIWTVILRSLGAKNAPYSRELIYIYAKSWLGRYIPGTAPWILGKIYFASKLGISKNKLAVSSILEAGLQIVVQMVFALSLLVFDPRLNIIGTDLKIGMTALIIVSLVALVPPVFNRIIKVVYKLLKRKQFPQEHYVSFDSVSKGFGMYIIGAIISSASLFFVALSVYPELSYNELLYVMGVGTLAGAVSMLAIFAPSGLGVREGIQLVLLSVIMPTEYALVITVLTRLWGIVTDFIFFILASINKR